MFDRFQSVSLASFLPEHLAALADIRGVPGVRIRKGAPWHWLRWDTEHEKVLRVLLPLSGITLYESRDDCWFKVGSHLPAFDVPPAAEFTPLHDVIFPAPVTPVAALQSRPWEAQTLRLIADDRLRPATASILDLREFAAWVDSVPSPRLRTLRWSVCEKRVLVLGKRLPPVNGIRYWGQRVLTPLGLRPDPLLAEGALLEAMNVQGDEWLVLSEYGVEIVPEAAFGPVTRANVRQTCEGART